MHLLFLWQGATLLAVLKSQGLAPACLVKVPTCHPLSQQFRSICCHALHVLIVAAHPPALTHERSFFGFSQAAVKMGLWTLSGLRFWALETYFILHIVKRMWHGQWHTSGLQHAPESFNLAFSKVFHLRRHYELQGVPLQRSRPGET